MEIIRLTFKRFAQFISPELVETKFAIRSMPLIKMQTRNQVDTRCLFSQISQSAINFPTYPKVHNLFFLNKEVQIIGFCRTIQNRFNSL